MAYSSSYCPSGIFFLYPRPVGATFPYRDICARRSSVQEFIFIHLILLFSFPFSRESARQDLCTYGLHACPCIVRGRSVEALHPQPRRSPATLCSSHGPFRRTIASSTPWCIFFLAPLLFAIASCSAHYLSHDPLRSVLCAPSVAFTLIASPSRPACITAPRWSPVPCALSAASHLSLRACAPFVIPRLVFRALRTPSHHTLCHFALYAHRYIILVSYALCALSHYTHRLAALLGAFAPARSAPHFALLVPGSTQTVVTSLV
ncbi:hypothetical protein K438DRAFT_1983268 [Mycena galopus ATCC 62051]|nr:hypothetical protein K438DRAFT_1983268 [Mycena galopus ATCC 62051]